MQAKSNLSNIQTELLKLYSNDISDSDLIEIKKLLAQYFANKLDENFEEFYKSENLTPEELIDWSMEHNRTSNR
jgi:hypothetical protein